MALGNCSLAAPFDFLAPKGTAQQKTWGGGIVPAQGPGKGTGIRFYEGVGFGLFIIGWMLLMIAAATYYKPKSTGGSSREITWNSKAGPAIIALSLTTLASSGMSFYYLSTQHSDLGKVGIYGLNAASFIALAVMIAYKKGYFDVDRFILAFIGVFCILLSMWNLSWNRRFYGFNAQENPIANPCSSVYNIGMPLFVIGWMLLVVASTME